MSPRKSPPDVSGNRVSIEPLEGRRLASATPLWWPTANSTPATPAAIVTPASPSNTSVLASKIDQIIGGWNMQPYRMAADGTTYCNFFLSDVLQRFSLSCGRPPRSLANQMYDWFSGNWSQAAGPAAAQALANQGFVVVAAMKGAVHGHVAILRPSQFYFGYSGPRVAQAGVVTSNDTTVRAGFGVSPEQVTYFYSPLSACPA